MSLNTHFTLLAFLGSEEVQKNINTICTDEKTPCSYVSERMDFLESLLDDEPDLVVFHTDIGEDEIIATLEIMNADSLCRQIPVIVISEFDDINAFAFRVKAFEVISILSYSNWSYQFRSLVTYLKSMIEKSSGLHKDLVLSESQNHLDPLTGALNRFGAEEKFEHLVAYYQDNNEDFSIIMFDIDYFKKVNDVYGHDVGDQVLVEISETVRNSIRKGDALFRFGGEEFIVFLANANLEVAKKTAENIRLKIESELYSNRDLSITASFGVVEYNSSEGLNTLVEKADQLLYKAKENGRNQVVFSKA